MSEIQTIEELQTTPEVVPYEDDGKDRMTHIISPKDNSALWSPGLTSKDIVDLARILGYEVVALCGYKFTPVHDPEKYPLCKACFVIAQNIIKKDG